MSVLSENITALRKKANETQNALANALGVSNRTVSKWENAESEPDCTMLISLADRYSVSVDDLLGHTKKTPANPYENMTPDEIALSYFRKIVDDTRNVTQEFMKKIYSEDDQEREPVLPPRMYRGRQSGVTDSSLFAGIVHGPDTNFITALMANEENYAWLDRDAEKLEKFFTLLGRPGMMKLMTALHTPGILDNFTADYAAELNGCDEKDVAELFDLIIDSTSCYADSYDAELEEGKARIYSYCGSGMMLALLNIAHEITYPEWCGDCILNQGYKPIKPVIIDHKEA